MENATDIFAKGKFNRYCLILLLQTEKIKAKETSVCN